jgi:hypothetical protein
MTWVTNYTLLKNDLKISNLHPDNTIICQKISRAAMKAAQEAANGSSCKERKIIFFHPNSSSCKTGCFFITLTFPLVNNSIRCFYF